MKNYLRHEGRLGQQWGVQNGPPYPLDISDKAYRAKQHRTTTQKLQKAVKKSAGMKAYDKELRSQYKVHNKSGKLNKNYAFAYNQKMADIMNKYVSTVIDSGEKHNYYSPNGMVLTFVAMRGDKIGVETALRTANYDLNLVKRGLSSDGRISYTKDYVNTYEDK